MASFDPMAASQINVDPSLDTPRQRGKSARQRQIYEMLVAQGMDPAKAEMEAARMVIREEGAAQAKEYDEANPNWRQKDKQAVQDKWVDQGQASVEMMPQQPTDQTPQWKLDMQAEQEKAQLESDLSQGGYGTRRVPGARGLDGRAAQGAPFQSVEEAEGYEARGKAPGMPGLYKPSQRDIDLQARGFVPVYNPDGTVTYRLEASGGTYVPGAPGRAGSRADLVGVRPDGSPAPYRVESMEGPTGGQQVIVPTDATRAKLKAAEAKAKERQAERSPYAGMPSPAERFQRFVAQVRLGGGRQTPQSIMTQQALEGMSPEQQQRSLQYMAPGGNLAAMVDAAHNQQLTQLGLRVASGQGFQGNVSDQALKMKNKADAQEWFDRWIVDNHGTRGAGGWTVGPYTHESMGRAVNYLMQRFGLSRAEAEAIAQSQGLPGSARAPAVPDAERTEGWSNGPGGLPTPPGSTPYRMGA